MVAPDLVGKGLGGWLLRFAESQAPVEVDTLSLYTGMKSLRNLAMYERADYRRTDDPAPDGAVHLVKPNPRPGS